METVDTTGILELTNESPEKAAENIEIANQNDIDPTTVANSRKQKNTASKVMSTQATRTVASEMESDPQKAAAMSKDLEKLNWAERALKYSSNQIKVSDLGRQSAEVGLRIMNARADREAKGLKGEGASEDDLFQLEILRQEIESAQAEIDALGLSNVSKGIGYVPVAVSDIWEDIKAQPLTVAGPALGGLVTMGIPGLIGGAKIGQTVASGIENFNRFSGETYNELSSAVDSNGQPRNISEAEKRKIAAGVATINTALEAGGDILLSKGVKVLRNNPLFGRILKPLGIGKLPDEEFTLLRRIGNLAGGFAAEGGTEGAQTIIEMLGKNLGDTWDGKATSLSNALSATASELGTAEGFNKVAESVVVGGVTGSTFRAGGQVTDKIFSGRQKNSHSEVAEKLKKGQPPPTAPASAESGSIPVDDPNPPLPPIPETAPRTLDAQRALTFALSVQGMIDGVNDTTIGKKSPTEAVKLQGKMLRDSGVNEMWFDADTITAFSNTQERADFVRNKFSKGQLKDMQNGAMTAVDVEVALEMIRMDPRLSKMVKENPEALTADQAISLYKQNQALVEEKMSEAGTRTAIDRPQVESTSDAQPMQPTPVDTTKLGPNSTDEEILSTLGDRQEANAYLGRLDEEEGRLFAEAQSQGLQTDDDFDDPRTQAIQQMRERVQALSESLPEQPVDNSPITLSENEELQIAATEFIYEPVMTDLVRAGVPQKLAAELEAKMQANRKDIAAAINQAGEAEMLKIKNFMEIQADLEQTINMIEDSLSDTNIEIVETWLANKKDLKIDPDSLTVEQKIKYIDEPVLQARKVFKKGGLSVDEVAQNLGLSNGDQILDILTNVPDMKTATDNAIELSEKEISVQSEGSVDPNDSAMIRALSDRQKLNDMAIKEIVKSSWGKARRFIENVSFAKLNLDTIRKESIAQVETTKVSQLNQEVYAKASLRAQKKAVIAGNRGNFLEAARQREIAIRNDEMRKQSLIYIKKANRSMHNIGVMLKSPRIRSMLERANMENAFDEFTTIINMETQSARKSQNSAFEKAVNKRIKDQTVDMSIPQELIETFDPRAKIGDLSYEQVKYIETKMREIVAVAKAEVEQMGADTEVYNRAIGERINKDLADHIDRDPNKNKPDPVKQKGLAQVYAFGDKVDASMVNIRTVVNDLTRGDSSKFIHGFIIDQLKGVGDYNNGFGTLAAKKDRIKFETRLTEIKEKHGAKRIDNYSREWMYIEEFQGAEGLLDSEGRIQKSTLLTLAAYYGDPEGRQRIRNYGLDPETVHEVTTTFLVKEDFDYIQDVTDSLDMFRPQIQRMIELTNDEDIEWVEGASYEAFGKTYRGGRVPLYNQSQKSTGDIVKQGREQVDQYMGEGKTGPHDPSLTKSFTKKGYMESRSKNAKYRLETNFGFVIAKGADQVITDTRMYVPILNIMNTLNQKSVAEDIVSVVGKQKFQAMRNHIIDSGKSVMVQRIENFQDLEKFQESIFQTVQNNVAGNQLLLGMKVFMNQLSSGFYMWREGGLSSTGTYLTTAFQTVISPKQAIEAASQIVPSVGDFRFGIDDRYLGSMVEALPADKHEGAIRNAVSQGVDKMRDLNLGAGLGTVDALLKTTAALTLQKRFLDGKVKGFDENVLSQMTDDQKFNAMQRYVVDVIDRTGTATDRVDQNQIQKGKLKAWATYFNDVRNMYNYAMFNAREVIRDAKAGRKAVKEGNYKKAVGHYFDAGGRYATFQIFNAAMIGFMNAVQGRDDEGEELPGFLTLQWEWEMAKDFAFNVLNPFSFLKTASQGLPLVRESLYAYNVMMSSNGRVRPMVAPMEVQAIAKVAYGSVAMTNLIINQNLNKSEVRDLNNALGVVLPAYPSSFMNRLMVGAESHKKAFYEDPGFVVGGLGYLAFKGYEAITGDVSFSMNSAEARAYEEIRTQIDPYNSGAVEAIKSGEMPVASDFEWSVIKQIESENNPNAYNASGAAGLYQFMPDTWNKYAVKFGYTLEDRFDPEKATVVMNELLKDNAVTLLRNNIPVNLETLYAAHHFGSGRVADIYDLPDNAPLGNLIPNSFRKANPWLEKGNKTYGIAGRVGTVGQFKDAMKKITEHGVELARFEQELAKNP